ALADKLDTLVGFWAIDEKPTGSKDPYALRRAALGAVRILLENGVRLGLIETLRFAAEDVSDHVRDTDFDRRFAQASQLEQEIGGDSLEDRVIEADAARVAHSFERSEVKKAEVLTDLLSFFHDRLKVYLRD